jgi:RecA-family ATPase
MIPDDAWTVADPTLCPDCGRDACEDHLPPEPDTAIPAPPVAAQPAPTRLTAQRALDLIDAPRPVEIIEGIAWAGCLTVLVSESGAGKTFALLDAAAAVSDDTPWHGRTIQQGSIAYFSYEGDALGLRLRALRDVTGRQLEHLYVVLASDPLSPRVSRDGEERSIGEIAVVAALETLATDLTAASRPPIVLLVIDTVRASLAGSEDSSEHVAAYLRAVRRIMGRVPRAACILAHHAGWQDGKNQRKRERGSSAWRGNCDATLYLDAGAYNEDRGEAPLTLGALKVRDAERPAPLHLVRRRVELAEMDRHGGPVTSCVIESDRRSREDRDAERVAKVNATNRELDTAVLRAMRDYPAATSVKRLRPYVSGRLEAVSDAVARLLRAQLAFEGKRGSPYTLTEAGLAILDGTKS